MNPINVRYITKHTDPRTLLQQKWLREAVAKRMATHAIWAAVLYTRPEDWMVIGPPPMLAGMSVLIIHGRPKHSRISRVLAPRALLMLMDPIPAQLGSTVLQRVHNMVIITWLLDCHNKTCNNLIGLLLKLLLKAFIIY